MKGQLDSAFAAWAPFVSFARLRALARVLSGVSGAAWSGWPGLVPEPRRKLAAALLSLMSAGAFSHMPFFFFPAAVSNSLRYKIKITYFVINILIY